MFTTATGDDNAVTLTFSHPNRSKQMITFVALSCITALAALHFIGFGGARLGSAVNFGGKFAGALLLTVGLSYIISSVANAAMALKAGFDDSRADSEDIEAFTKTDAAKHAGFSLLGPFMLIPKAIEKCKSLRD